MVAPNNMLLLNVLGPISTYIIVIIVRVHHKHTQPHTDMRGTFCVRAIVLYYNLSNICVRTACRTKFYCVFKTYRIATIVHISIVLSGFVVA